jgi:general secretion pathway protein E
MLQKKIRLGDLLVERGLITQEQLLAAIAVQKSDGTDRRLGHVLVDEGLISEEVILRTLADQLKAVYLEPGSFEGDVRLAKKLQAGVLKRALAVPVREERGGYLIAFADPLDLGAQDTIQRLLPDKPVIVAITAESEVLKIITRLETMEGLEETIEGVRREMRAENRNERDEAASSVVRLIEIIFTTAITRGASDIHIEPSEAQCHVRGRIDGFLTELFVFDADIFPPLSSRIKLLGDLDIGERRKPQDGRFSHTVRGVEYDFRLSTLPVSGGESVVMRILDKSKALIRLSELGLNQNNLTRFREAMESPYGIVFVTGPTGSGKTTTLYAALNEIKNIERKIITVEDPIEYRMNLLQQVQVNEKAGMGFAGALRSILRQDPDVIMVGESRDKETIAIAIQAALTGHLVFTTLHTNDAISAITRVVDMGIEPFLVASSVVAIQAQRLVRRICPACKHAVKYPPELLERIAPHWPEDLGEITFYRGSGCKRCGTSGYQGRTMITEVLSFSDKLQEGIARGVSRGEILAMAKSEGFEEMFTDGIRKVAAGESTLEEVMRVAKL